MYDLKGKQFSKLRVLCRTPDKGGAGSEIWWTCVCECGKITSVRSYLLRKGMTTSCGCYGLSNLDKTASTKHGLHQTPTYHSWEKMKSRCDNPNNPSYSRYGGLGVCYTHKWKEFSNFLQDMGLRPEGTSLDRIDPFGNYEPSNCRWATPKTQANNTRRKKISEGVTFLC